MKKLNIITSLAIGLALLPFYASAESTSTTTISATAQLVTEAQVFTACSQAAIEMRDSAIGSARTSYNIAMSEALSARKDAEKEAVALTNTSEKKDSIRVAVEEYKKTVTSAQDNLTKARKIAWAAFETNTNSCRDISKEARKSAATEKKADVKTMQVEQKAEIEEIKKETKTLRESFMEQLESLKNIFRKGE